MFKPRFYQEEGIAACLSILNSTKKTCKELVVAPTGCHSKGRRILMYDGTFKNVEDVVVGDILMSPFSDRREVLSLIRGKGKMYRITLRNKITFLVNGDHILQLYRTGNSNKPYQDATYPKEVSVSVNDYLGWAKSRKHLYKIKRVGVSFSENKSLQIDPYFLGLWLGDGTSNQMAVTTIDQEIKSYLKNFSSIEGLSYKESTKRGTGAVTVRLTFKRGIQSPLRKKFTEYGLISNKHIPFDYKTSSKKDRFSLLSGLIDSDGHYDARRGRYSIISKYKTLAEDIYYLCNSLGLCASINIKKTKCNNCGDISDNSYYRVSFRQDFNIKCKIYYKNPVEIRRQGNGDMYSFSVCELREDNFYGFHLDKDHLYLDEDFIIHHNSGKSLYISDTVKKLDEPVLVLQPNKELLSQNYGRFVKMGGVASICCSSLTTKTIDSIPYTEIDGELINCREVSKVTYATVGSVKAHLSELKAIGVKKAIIDEAHLGTKSDSQIRKLFNDLGVTHVVGLTATPVYLQGGLSGASLKMMNRTRGKLFSTIRQVTQISTLVRSGFWSKLLYQVNDTDESYLRQNSNGSDFTVKSLTKFYESNNLKGKILEEVRNLLQEGRKSILVFVPTIQEANDLFASFPNSAVVHSKMDSKDRDYVVEAFRKLIIPVVFNVNILSCLDLETEVLTDSGWVSYDRMTYEHKVANWDKGDIYFKEPSNIIYKDLEQDEYYYSYESESINFRVTNNHDLLLRNQRQKEYSKIRAEEVEGRILKAPVFGEYTPEQIEIPQEKRNLKSTIERRVSANSYNIRKRNPKLSLAQSQWLALRDIEKRDNLKYKNPHELTNEECELIGFFLGDGSKYKKGKNEQIYTISQSFAYPKIIDRVDELLGLCNIDFSSHKNRPDKKSTNESITWQLNKGTGYGAQSKEGVYKIIPYLDKNGSKYLKYLSKEQFKCLLKGFWLADGNHGDSVKKSSRGFNITNTNYKLLSLMQEISVTRGIRASIRILSKPKEKIHKQLFMLQISSDKECTINNKYKINREEHKPEKTWCVTVESSNILIRRRGKVMVIGNCGFDHPELDGIITARPTGSIAVYYQQIGRGVRIYPDKKDCKVVDFSGNVKKFGRVEGLHFEDLEHYGWGLFNEKDELLTDYPLAAVTRPTKKSLMLKYNKTNLQKNVVEKDGTTVLWFGKHKGKSIKRLVNTEKNYVSWMYDEFNFQGAKMKKLKREIEVLMALPITV